MLFGLLLTMGCRKDRLNIPKDEISNQKQQKISEATILKWMQTNPAAQALTLDWKNARQSVIEGKNVVRIPTLNVDKISSLNKSVDLKLSTLAGARVQLGNKNKIADAPNPAGTNANYYAQHPPEVFFVQENGKEDVHTFLLNFVPTNPTKEFGQDSLWTGKLYEWNMTGDTLLVQELNKSKILKRYGIKMKRENSGQQGSLLGKDGVVTNLNSNKISSAWRDFWSAVAEIWGDIGAFFGVAHYDDVDHRNEWDVFDWEGIGNFFSRIFGGSGDGGGGSGSGSYGYTGSGSPIYDSYAPGYQSPDGGGGGSSTWDPYYNSGGGTPHGSNNGGSSYSSSLNYLLNVIVLTDEEIAFLHNQELNDPNNSIARALENYLEAYSTEPWDEKLEFVKWAIGYLNENRDVDFSVLTEMNNITNSSINLPNLDVSELGNYPKFKALVEDLPNFINNYPNILKALEYTTGFSTRKIKELMQPGKGPKVVVINNLKDKDGYDILGHYDSENKVLQIDNGYVDGLNVVNNPVRYQAIGLMLTITTLHEFVHFGTKETQSLIVKNRLKNPAYEPGWDFERAIQPTTNPGDLTPENALQWLKFYKIKPKKK